MLASAMPLSTRAAASSRDPARLDREFESLREMKSADRQCRARQMQQAQQLRRLSMHDAAGATTRDRPYERCECA